MSYLWLLNFNPILSFLKCLFNVHFITIIIKLNIINTLTYNFRGFYYLGGDTVTGFNDGIMILSILFKGV